LNVLSALDDQLLKWDRDRGLRGRASGGSAFPPPATLTAGRLALLISAMVLQSGSVSGWDLTIDKEEQLVCTGGASYV